MKLQILTEKNITSKQTNMIQYHITLHHSHKCLTSVHTRQIGNEKQSWRTRGNSLGSLNTDINQLLKEAQEVDGGIPVHKLNWEDESI